MTVSDAIERAEGLFKYSGDTERLVLWLSELEERINLELFNGKEGKKIDIDSELTAPNAYSEMYPLYLAMKSALSEGRPERYNDLARCFEGAYSEYIDHVNRTRTPTKAIQFRIL